MKTAPRTSRAKVPAPNIALSREQLLARFAERLRRYRDDPVGFCQHVLDVDPHDGQKRWLRNAVSTENALTSGNRWGKSIHFSTKVKMANGSEKRIEDLVAGDVVVGVNMDGTTSPATVLEVHDHGVLPMFRHEFSKRQSAASFTSSMEHKMLARPEWSSVNLKQPVTKTERRKKSPIGRGNRIVRADQLGAGWLAQRALGLEADTFGLDEDLATFFGLIIGDGCYNKIGNTMRFTCADEDVLALAQESVSHYEYAWKATCENSVIQYRLGLASGELGDDGRRLRARMEAHGMDGRYSYEKNIPEAVSSWSNAAVARFIGALILTDGYVSLRGKNYGEQGQVGFTSTALPLIEGLKKLLEERFGIYCSSVTNKTRVGAGKKTEYNLSIGSYGSLVRFSKNIPLVGRKARALVAVLENWTGKRSDSAELTYRSSTYVGDEQAYDITIDNETHLFALANGLIVSNSEGAAMRSIWRCTYLKGWNKAIGAMMMGRHAPYHGINIAMTADQANLVWNKANAMLQGRKASWLVRDARTSPFPKITFINGAEFEARSSTRDGEHLLGHNYDFINWDECAFEKKFKQIRDNVLRMRLLDRSGTLDYTSTGNGRNDYGIYFLSGLPGPKKDPMLYSQSGPTWENPFMPADRLKMLIAGMSDRKRQQNIEGAIIDAGGNFFEAADLEVAYDEALDGWLKQTFDEDDQTNWAELFPDETRSRSWRDTHPGHRYFSGWDLAEKKDFCVGTTWDITTKPATLVEFERFRRQGWDRVYDRMRARDAKYGARTTKFDSTGVGDVVGNELKDIHAEGFNFGGAGKKDALLQGYASLLSLRGVRWPAIQVFRDEHAFYERDDENLTTDCVMSAAIAAWWIAKKPGIISVDFV